MIRRYSPRQMEIEAIQFDGSNEDEIIGFLNGFALNLSILEFGDYVMRTPAGAYGVVPAGEFGSLYEDVTAGA